MTFHPANHLPGCMMPDGGECCAGHVAVVEDWHRQRREIERLTGTPAQSMGMREALERIAIVCTQNMDRDKNHRIALDGVRQIANDYLDASQPSPVATVETKPFSAKENLREVVAQVQADIEAAQLRSSAESWQEENARLREALRLTRRALKEEMDFISEELENSSAVERPQRAPQ